MNEPGRRSGRPEGPDELATSPSLLGRVLANEPAAWNRLVALYAPLVWHWCRKRHRGRSRTWIKKRYFQASGHRHWIFTGTLFHQNGPGRPIELMVAAQVKIIRCVKIRSVVNPYDPEWELYLEARLGWQLTQTRTGRSRMESLWKRQKGRCLACGQPLRIAEEDCQIHHRIWRSEGGPDTADNLELLHANCHRQIHVQERRTKATASREGR